jgi:hypothetical protein
MDAMQFSYDRLAAFLVRRQPLPLGRLAGGDLEAGHVGLDVPQQVLDRADAGRDRPGLKPFGGFAFRNLFDGDALVASRGDSDLIR